MLQTEFEHDKKPSNNEYHQEDAAAASPDGGTSTAPKPGILLPEFVAPLAPEAPATSDEASKLDDDDEAAT